MRTAVAVAPPAAAAGPVAHDLPVEPHPDDVRLAGWLAEHGRTSGAAPAAEETARLATTLLRRSTPSWRAGEQAHPEGDYVGVNVLAGAVQDRSEVTVYYADADYAAHRLDGPAIWTFDVRSARMTGARWLVHGRDVSDEVVAAAQGGVDQRSALRGIRDGVRTSEGLRRVAAGEPAEWVMAFEGAAQPR